MNDTPRADKWEDYYWDSDYIGFDEVRELERELNETNSRMVELKHKQASLIAAVNYAINEFPSTKPQST